MGTEAATVDPALVKRAVLASALGNATEWFDYGVYAYGVGYITANFFSGSGTQGTFYALLTFAVSFLVRPLGGLVWGPLGDRLGRRRVLATTIIMMAAATFCVGLLPTYATIGVAAPILLVVLRMVQGFSTGGEYGGAATFMAEYAPDKRRGFFGSFLEFGTIAGFTLGALLMLAFSLALGDEAMTAWGWRLPFLIAGPLGLIGFYLRSKLEDTPVFRELEQAGEAEEKASTALGDLLRGYWRPMLTLAGLTIALNVTNYTLLSYMPTYLEQEIGMSANATLTLVIVGQLVMMCAIPFAGGASDRLGRRRMWLISLAGLFVMAIPMYMLMRHSIGLAILGFAVLGLLYVPQLATISATFPALFPTHVRYAGFAISYNVATSLFGGTAPAVNDKLIGATGDTLVPAYYMMASCVVGLIALAFMPETAGASLRGRGIPGTAQQQVSYR